MTEQQITPHSPSFQSDRHRDLKLLTSSPHLSVQRTLLPLDPGFPNRKCPLYLQPHLSVNLLRLSWRQLQRWMKELKMFLWMSSC